MKYYICYRRKDRDAHWLELRWSPVEKSEYNFKDYDFKIGDEVYTDDTQEWQAAIEKIALWDALNK